MREEEELANAASRHEWRNRPRLTSVTPEALDAVPDRWLEQVLLDFVWAHGVTAGSDTRRLLEVLPSGFRTVYSAWLVDSEVKNGGFQQYFWNQGDVYLTMTGEALSALGARLHAEVFREACEAFGRWSKPAVDGLPAGQQLAAFVEAAHDGMFESLDDRWFGAEDLEPTRLRFIRSHADLFVASLRGWRRFQVWLRRG